MKSFAKILGIVCLIGGSALAAFTAIPIADYIGIGVAALGLALLIGSTWKKAEKKTWKEIVAIILFAVAGFLCGFAGIADTVFTQVATAIFGIVSLVAGLIVSAIKKKD